MAERNYSPKRSKVEIGALQNRINIQRRDVVYLHNKSQYSFVTVYERWSAIETVTGLKYFNGIQLDEAVTHIFRIRTIEELTSEFWVNFGGQNYKIISINKYNEEKFKHQALLCRIAGEEDLEGAMS